MIHKCICNTESFKVLHNCTELKANKATYHLERVVLSCGEKTIPTAILTGEPWLYFL